MRVSFIAEFVNFGVGGINAQVYRLQKALKAKGIDVHVNSYGKKADVVHAHTPFWRAFASTSKDAPKIATVHSIPEGPAHYFPRPLQRSFSAIGWKYYKTLYPRFDRNIAPTEYVREQLEAHDIPVEKVLSNGVDLSVFKNNASKEKLFRQRHGIDDPYVLSVGDIRPAKNTELMNQLAMRLPNIRFVHIGIPNSLAPSFYFQKVMREKPANITFVGRTTIDELVGAYSGATAFVHPSKIETEGLVILEALACRAPVVASHLPAYRGWLAHQQNSLLSNSLEEFVKNVKQISQNKHFRRKLSQSGFLTAKQRSFTQTVQEHVRLYEELASR